MPVHCSSGAAPSMPRPTAVYNRGMAAPESRRYHCLQLLLGLTRLALGTAYLAVVLLAGGGHALAALAAGVTASAAGQVALVAAALGAGHTLLGLPTAWLSSWVLPRRYGLLHQPLRAWLADRAKAAALGAAIGLAGVGRARVRLRDRADGRVAGLGPAPLLSADAAGRRDVERAAAGAGRPRRRERRERLDRRSVTQEPDGQRRRDRARAHTTHPAVRHAHGRLPARGDRGGARARAGPSRPRRPAPRPARAGRAQRHDVLDRESCAARRRRPLRLRERRRRQPPERRHAQQRVDDLDARQTDRR